MTTSFYRLSTLASTYGSGSYNSSTYNGSDATSTGSTTGTSGGSTAAGGTLSNTGVLVGLIVGMAAFILLVAMVVRIWRRPNRPAEVTVENEPTDARTANQ